EGATGRLHPEPEGSRPRAQGGAGERDACIGNLRGRLVGADRGLRTLAELQVEQGPQLGRPASVVEGEDPGPAQLVLDDQVVLVAERGRVVPVHLAVAARRNAGEGVPPGCAQRVTSFPMANV